MAQPKIIEVTNGLAGKTPGSANGLATLGSDGKVPSAQLPAGASSVNFTLTSAGWSGSASLYTQTASVTGVTATSVGTFGLATSATKAQYEAAAGAMMLLTAQAADSVTITAYGDKPSTDIPCVINIVG